MPTKIEDLPYKEIIDGSQVLSLFFGDEVLSYSYLYKMNPPARLRSALETLRDFEGWIEDAMSVGQLEVFEMGTTFYLHVWKTANLCQLILANRILERLEKRGWTSEDGLKKAIEVSAKTVKPIKPALRKKLPQAPKAKLVKKPRKLKTTRPKAPPAPTTDAAKKKALKAKAFNIYTKATKNGKDFTYKDFAPHADWREALEDSGYEKDHVVADGTLSNWLTKFRQLP